MWSNGWLSSGIGREWGVLGRERNEDSWKVFGCGSLTGKGALAGDVAVNTTDFPTYSFLLAPVLLGPV